ncbi:uncharacterized protein LOC129770486 [Toxorhynchites rutilus septentrionalis]|uniref:uncharacterized protein LOC129770486 n=1 Tax=Toxorhynchites rutilus septentrionalis TaxID=329112 RepID=UPI002479BABB|nr:uncharacterized protein LOC129770486 [Toxorhynchites rutilus septentrionalis]
MYVKLLLLIGCVAHLHAAPQSVPGKLLRASSAAGPTTLTTTCDGTGYYTQCSGCNSILVCLGSFSDTRKCDVLVPDTPYCVNGTCSAQPSYDTCPPPALKCTGEGYYPDPNNCKLYHYCEVTGEPSDVYECSPNYVFNGVDGCKQQIFPSDCVTCKCDPSKIFVGYGNSKIFYAYCVYQNAKVTDIIMSKCSGASTFNGVKCDFKCPSEGNFAYEGDKKRYYQCYTSGGKLTFTVQSCSNSDVFNPEYGVCVPAS